MHDPMTLAFTIPNPFTRRIVSWRKRPYYDSLIEVWHVDPECHGNDDSCDWFGSHRLTDEQREWLRKKGEDEHQFFFRGVLKLDDGPDGTLVDNPREERWDGGMVHASSFEVLYGIASIILWGMPGYRYHERPLGSVRMRLALSAVTPLLLSLVSHSSDNVHHLVAEARDCTDKGQKAMGSLFVCVGRNLLQRSRPWYQHPRWHVHHWSITVTPWRNLKHWLTRRCVDCGKRMPWEYAPIHDARGFHHHDCIHNDAPRALEKR